MNILVINAVSDILDFAGTYTRTPPIFTGCQTKRPRRDSEANRLLRHLWKSKKRVCPSKARVCTPKEVDTYQLFWRFPVFLRV